MNNKRHCIQLAEGDGPPIMLSHALGLDHSMWADFAATWQGLCPVLAYDHRGHGRSPLPGGEFGMADLVDDAAEAITRWGRGPVVFVGLSMGGMVAQGLALQRPDLLRGIVLAHTVARYGDAARQGWLERIATVQQGGMAVVVDTVLSRYLTDDARQQRPELEARLRRLLLAQDPFAYARACSAVARVDWWDSLPGIRVPTLVIAGAHDAGAPPAVTRALQERIAGASHVLLEQASHLGVLETPQPFRDAVAGFVAQL